MTVSINNLSFAYGKKNIFTDASLQAVPGDIIAVIGENGSGKTTLLKLLAGLIFPDSGEIVFDTPPSGERPHMAGILETPRLWNELSGRENLQYYLEKQYEEKRVDAAFSAWGLSEYADAPLRKYSLGMKQKLSLLLTFESDADLLLFDEPTNSLDLQSVSTFYHQVQAAAARGKIIILATHIMYELEKNCTCIYEIKDLRLRQKLSLGLRSEIYEICYESEQFAKSAAEKLDVNEVRGQFKSTVLVSTEQNSISEMIRKTAEFNIVSVKLRSDAAPPEMEKAQ